LRYTNSIIIIIIIIIILRISVGLSACCTNITVSNGTRKAHIKCNCHLFCTFL